MGSKGQTTTSNSNTSQNQTYTPTGGSYITNALNQAQNLGGQSNVIPQAPVAGFSQDQQNAFQNVRNAQGMAQPYINQAGGYFSPQGAQQFYNPMAANVTANLQDIFGQQQAQTTGQLTQAAGGVGADRIAVGQANLAKEQGLAAGQTYSQLWNNAVQQAQGAGYGTAALGSQAQNAALQGAQAQLGTGGLQQQLSQAQLNAPYQQQLAQQQLPYQQASWLSNIVGSLAPGLGGTSYGTGTTNNAQTAPGPSLWSQILGGGAAAAGIYGGFGGFGGKGSAPSWGGGSPTSGDAYGGSGANPLPGLTSADYGAGYAEGGEIPNDDPVNVDARPFFPTQQIARIQPHIPQLNLSPPQQQQQQQQKGDSGGGGIGDLISMGSKVLPFLLARGGPAKSPYDFNEHRFPQGYADGGSPEMSEADQAAMMPETYANPLVKKRMGDLFSLPQRAIDGASQDAAHFGEHNYERQAIGPAVETAMQMIGSGTPFAQRGALGTSGGGYADGGGLDLEDRFAPVRDALTSGDFDAQGMNSTTFDPFKPVGRGLPSLIAKGTTTGAAPATQAMNFAPEEGTDEGAPAAAPASPAADPEPPRGATNDSFVNSPWAALTAAGLGIMGGTSPFAGVNIGQGAQQGLKMLEQQRAATQKDTTIQQSADRLAQEARFHEDQYKRMTPYQQKTLDRQKAQDDLAERRFNRPYDELTEIEKQTIAHQKRQDELAQERFNKPYQELTKAEQAQLEESKRQHDLARLPQGFQYKTDEKGNVIGQEPTPGGPHSPEQIRAEADAKRLPGMSEEALAPLVDSYMVGNTGVLTGVGRGTQGAQNLEKFWTMMAKKLTDQGMGGKDLAAARANFTAQTSAARVAAQRESNIETAVNEAKGTFPEVLRTSALLPRSTWTPVNEALNYFRTKSGSPAQGQFGAAIQAAITAYSQAMSRTGANSVYAQQHAAKVLAEADGHEALQAKIDQLNTEMAIAQHAPEEARQAILKRIGMKTDQPQQPAGAAAAAGTAAAPAAPAVTRPPNLPAGSQYSPSKKMWRTPDGKMFDATGQPVQ